MEINEIIQRGETKYVEFKSWIKANKKELMNILTNEAVGFANTDGGLILVGVEDDGEITGCYDYDEQNIIESIYDKTMPKLFTDVEIIRLAGKDILKITIEQSPEIVATSKGVVYKRLGKNTKPFYPSEYNSNNIKGFKGDYSAKIIEPTTKDDIDFAEVERLKLKIQSRDKDSTLYQSDNITLLKDLRLIDVVGEEIQLTVAGLLFVGTNEAIAKYMPQAEIIILTYNDGHTEYNKRLELKMPLVKTVDRIQQFFEDRNGIKNIQMGLFKLEVQDYPINVFQEALLNAISHRDYESNSSIFVKFYPNEIIIENPGSFPSGVDSTNIITHPSSPRNKLIAETLQKLKYVQRSGQGVDIIFKDMLSLGKSAPEYNLYSEAVSLTLRSSLEDMEFLKFITKEEENNGEFSVSEICILKYVKSNKTITLGKAAEVAQITTQSAANVLNKLCQKRNILQREARNKYMFTHRVYESLDDNIEYTKDKDFDEIQAKTMIIDYLNKNGTITRLDVERLCGFSSTSSKRILQSLREAEIIVLEGKARASYYRLK
ncbi:putative DNA binding domain-containing protein [Alkalihalobacillus sp. MEB130]|uniref:RNA-binding domain-containing protein n=1 Tax=Alkalihalobacillus sp. MEB130 TaxID=2976704 RepID=UPI0028E06A1F|nr:RNA-binding domain-containing protein [Alkalihalobacillus sp. MEB130]MDT8862796.1 putative DNA binding domain-containing protein [Alkalihalobacillus sp. MEB130]